MSGSFEIEKDKLEIGRQISVKQRRLYTSVAKVKRR